MLMLRPHADSLGLTIIRYGNGFVSFVVIGGMWSFSSLAMVTTFIAAFWRLFSIALRTFSASEYGIYQSLLRNEFPKYEPDSFRGLAKVMATVHCSQQTSSSAFPKK